MRWLLFLGLFLSSVTDLYAQVQGEGSDTNIAESYPIPTADAELYFETDFGRQRIAIHRVDPASRIPKGLIYHGIALAFDENPNPLPGYPSTVYDVNVDRRGDLAVMMKVILTSPGLQQRVRDRFWDARPEIIEEWGLSGRAGEIEVRPWPIHDLHIEVSDFGTQDVLWESYTPNIGEMVTSVFVRISVPPDQLELFKEKLQENDLQFLPTYKSLVRGGDTGRKVEQGTIRFLGEINYDIGSAQEGAESFISQSEVNRVLSKVEADIRRAYYVTDPELIPILMPRQDLAAMLFSKVETRELAELTASDPLIQAQLSAYLKPHLVTIAQSEGTEVIVGEETINEKTDLSAEADQKMKRDYTKSAFKVKAGVGTPGGPNAGAEGSREFGKENVRTKTNSQEHMERQLERVTAQTGISFEKQIGDEYFRPHEIKLYKRVAGEMSVQINDVSSVFLAKNSRVERQTTSPTPGSLSIEDLEDGVSGETLMGYSGVPIGAILPFAGQAPPPGFDWYEPPSEAEDDPAVPHSRSGYYPDNEHFPSHLRGEPFPDLRDTILGSVTNAAVVGLPIEGTTNEYIVEVPAQTLKGTSLSVSKLNVNLGVSKSDTYFARRGIDAKYLEHLVGIWFNKYATTLDQHERDKKGKQKIIDRMRSRLLLGKPHVERRVLASSDGLDNLGSEEVLKHYNLRYVSGVSFKNGGGEVRTPDLAVQAQEVPLVLKPKQHGVRYIIRVY